MRRTDPAIPDNLVQSCLAHAVAEDPGEGPGAGHAGDVDHVALAGHQVELMFMIWS